MKGTKIYYYYYYYYRRRPLAHAVYVQLLVFNDNNKYKLHLLNNIKRRVCSCSLNGMSCILCCFPDFSSGKE